MIENIIELCKIDSEIPLFYEILIYHMITKSSAKARKRRNKCRFADCLEITSQLEREFDFQGIHSF